MIIIMLNFISEQKINHLKTRIRCLMIVSASLFHHFHVALLGDGVFFFKPCRTLYRRRSQTKDNEETKALRRCKGRRRRRTKRKAELERRERERERCLCRVSFTPPAHVALVNLWPTLAFSIFYDTHSHKLARTHFHKHMNAGMIAVTCAHAAAIFMPSRACRHSS